MKYIIQNKYDNRVIKVTTDGTCYALSNRWDATKFDKDQLIELLDKHHNELQDYKVVKCSDSVLYNNIDYYLTLRIRINRESDITFLEICDDNEEVIDFSYIDEVHKRILTNLNSNTLRLLNIESSNYSDYELAFGLDKACD